MYNLKTCAKVAACHYVIQSNGNEMKKNVIIHTNNKKKCEEIKKMSDVEETQTRLIN